MDHGRVVLRVKIQAKIEIPAHSPRSPLPSAPSPSLSLIIYHARLKPARLKSRDAPPTKHKGQIRSSTGDARGRAARVD
ncbi:unnamed protein product, partial [Iphiclides podalirius]